MPANRPNGQRNPWRLPLLPLREHPHCELTAPAKQESGLARCQNSTSPPASLAEQVANLDRLWPRLWATSRLRALHSRFQESLRRRLQAPASMAARPERATSPRSPFVGRRVGLIVVPASGWLPGTTISPTLLPQIGRAHV